MYPLPADTHTMIRMARMMVAPSIQPVLGPSFTIPTMVETIAATTKILSIKSSKHSQISLHKDLGLAIIGSFTPNHFLLSMKSIWSVKINPVFISILSFAAKPSIPPCSSRSLTDNRSRMLSGSKSFMSSSFLISK